jgi:hypothetical protein
MTGAVQKICNTPPTRKSIPSPNSLDKDIGTIIKCSIPAIAVVAAATRERARIFVF